MYSHAPTLTGSEIYMFFTVNHHPTEVFEKVSKDTGPSVFAGSNVLMDYLTSKCTILNHSVTVSNAAQYLMKQPFGK